MSVSTNIEIRGVDKTKAAFASVNKSMGSLKNSLGGLKGAVAGLIGAGGLVALASEFRSTADQIGKVSERLGIGTSDLQKFQIAASQGGMDVRTFNMALQRFTRRTAEAAMGGGEAKDVIAEMGLQLRDNEGNLRSNADLLMDVSKILSSDVMPQADKVRIAFKLFDSEGAQLINTLQKGPEAIMRVGEAMEDFGVIINRDAIKASEQLGDRMEMIAKKAMNLFAPAIVLANKALDTFFEKTELASLPLPKLQNKIQATINELVKKRDALKDTTETTFSFALGARKSVVSVDSQRKSIQKQIDTLADQRDAITKQIQKIEESNEAIKLQKEILEQSRFSKISDLSEQEESLKLYKKEVEQARLLLGERKAGFQITQQENDLFGKKLDEQFQQSQNFQRALDKQRKHYQDVKKIVSAIDKLTPGGITSPSTFSAAKEIVGKTIESFGAFTQTLQGGLAGLSDQIFASAGAAGSRAKGFIDSIKESKNAQEALVNGTLNLILSNEKVGEALGKVFEAIFALVDPIIESLVPVLDEIAEIFKELAPVFKLLMPAIKASLQPLIGAAHALGEIAKIITKVATELSNLADKFSVNIGGSSSGGLLGGAIIPGLLEKGGPAFRNQPYIVGEAGPELFIPSSSGRVLPNSQTMQPVIVNVYDGTGRKLSEYDSAIRVEIQNRADRYNQFPALSAA